MEKRPITWEKSTIMMTGNMSSNSIADFSTGLHSVCISQGYKDVSLDFSKAIPVLETFMVPAIALVRRYMCDGFSFRLILPEAVKAKSLFHNANWAHLIDPNNNNQTTFISHGRVPASIFSQSSEQDEVVNKVVSMLISLIGLERKQLAALEWAINEISDNVLNHSKSTAGGVIQASSFSVGGRKMVEFVVADAGIGIKESLGTKTDQDGVERAIKEGVTRDQKTNQGNGLYGTYRVATLSKGLFELRSGNAYLRVEGDNKARIKQHRSRFNGTVVVCRIGCDDDKLIENALMFKGAIHNPGFDYIEKKYKDQDGDFFVFKMSEECTSFGSRESGVLARTLIENIIRSHPDTPIRIDFSGISIISSSFADEVFGRLFVSIGPMAFMSRVSFYGVGSPVRAILDRAISLRMSEGISSRFT